jgi:paraquat-inducible protein B
MSDLNQENPLNSLPSAILKHKRHWSPQIIWIIPILAVLVGMSLVVKTIINTGPTITISFKSGDGLVAGKTNVSYKGVNVGLVKTVNLRNLGSNIQIQPQRPMSREVLAVLGYRPGLNFLPP